ncbi:MAG: ornithine carbamoyltransferase [Eggerthellaceae bacterium]|nr:ornithine carbamoyltransferase [Eggerthellaceae bacterium]
MASLKGRDLLKLLDFTTEEILHLLDLSHQLKKLKHEGVPHRFFEGRNIVLLFEKTSTRTRCSFEVAGYDLGMGVTFLDPASSQVSKKESIADTARVLSRFYDGIEYRGFAQSIVEELAEYADCPVWNGLTNEWHPTQMIADIMTMQENFGMDLRGRTLVFMGDARNNVANSLMVVCAKLGINFVACGPAENQPEAWLIETCTKIAAENGSTVVVTDDVEKGCAGADAIYTDVWVSMGEPDEVWEQRIASLSPYQVNARVMELAGPDAIFLHCLPSFHDTNTVIGARIAEQFGINEMEVTNEVFESEQSRVFDEAENRMHAIKAVIYATMSDEPLSD